MDRDRRPNPSPFRVFRVFRGENPSVSGLPYLGIPYVKNDGGSPPGYTRHLQRLCEPRVRNSEVSGDGLLPDC
jgi:hypothetical protein